MARNHTPNPIIASRDKEMGIGNELRLVLQSKSTISTEATRQEENMCSVNIRDEKLEIFKALRLSQTRAREAEWRAAVLAKERDVISNALIHESSRLFAYKQWVKLLELQVSMLHRQHHGPISGGRKNKEDDNEGGEGSMVWFVALALCFSIATLGFALVSDTYLDPIPL